MTSQNPITVASRARRALRDMAQFRFCASASPIRGPDSEVLAYHGDLIGIYVNPPGVEPAFVVVTSQGMGCIGSKRQRWIMFDDVEGSHGPREKLVDDCITIVLKSGSHMKVRIAGGDGRFRDVYSFVRFIDRVVSDRKGAGG